MEERKQNLTILAIEEELKIIDMIEDQEILVGSGNRYCYIPENRDDCATRTGQPKYLLVDTCKVYGMNCEPSMKYKEVGRKKRSSFTTGLIQAGEKLLDRSPGGLLVEMVKTLAKPIYNLVINTDNDPVMEKFTNRKLPETQFRGHHE